MDAGSSRFVRLIGRVARLVCAAGALVAGTAALATGPSAHLDIVATPASVTRSSPALPTYASYKLTITSLDHDRLKKFSFKGTVAVQGSTENATLFSAEGATCTLAAGGALDCAVPGELAYYGKSLSFTVTLKTPVAGSAIAVSGKATFFDDCYWKHSNTASASTELTAPDPSQFSTYVPASATAPTTLFSGSQTQSGVVGAIPVVDSKALPPINDPFTTTIVVPTGSAATTASVAERELLQSCSANPRCFETTLAMPGSFSFLTIILRRDKTTLMASSRPKGHGHHDDKNNGNGHDRDDDDDGRYSGQSSIDNAIVKYFPDDDPANLDRFIIVPNCSVVPGGVPTPKNPCIASRKAYPVPKKGKPAVPAGLEGDWEFVIHALDNGRYVN